METSKNILNEEISELKIMLKYVEDNYKQVYEEAETHYMNQVC